MDSETETKITETVLDILKSADLAEATEYAIRNSASEKLGIDLTDPIRKQHVRLVVELYLLELNAKQLAEAEEEGDEKRRRGGSDGAAKEYDDCGDLIICRLSAKRRVTVTEFRGKTLVSLREYYMKDGKELPSSKGISLTKEQWGSLKRNVSAIEEAIKKMESRLH